MLAVTTVGTSLSYSANKAGDSREFIGRYVCLRIPIAIHVIAAEFGVYFAYLFVGFLVLGEAFEEHIESTS